MENIHLNHWLYTVGTPSETDSNASAIILSNVIDSFDNEYPEDLFYDPAATSLFSSQSINYCMRPLKEAYPCLEEDFNFDLLNWDAHMTNVAPKESMLSICALDNSRDDNTIMDGSLGSVTEGLNNVGRIHMGAWNGRLRSSSLGFEDISKYFYMTITDAAKELKVGLTLLKKRCRELGIPRWPHRKMKSLKSLIHNIQELESVRKDEHIKREIMTLEEHKRLMEKMPQLELSERAKKLRQACFKANYKKRKAVLFAK